MQFGEDDNGHPCRISKGLPVYTIKQSLLRFIVPDIPSSVKLNPFFGQGLTLESSES